MAADKERSSPVQKIKPIHWVGYFIVYLIVPVILLICGWDLQWWQAWIYSLIIVLAGLGGRIWAESRHPGILAERVKFVKSAELQPWDKILAPLVSISVSYPLIIVAGLDHRFGWTAPFSLWLNILGLVLCAIGYGLAIWALVENRFFSTVVRIQLDRGQTVCDSGPYRIVRHPGYAGNILALAGIVLALNSLWTIIPAAVALILLVIRTALEDRTLHAELPGYKEYAQKTRYRLLPGIY